MDHPVGKTLLEQLGEQGAAESAQHDVAGPLPADPIGKIIPVHQWKRHEFEVWIMPRHQFRDHAVLGQFILMPHSG